MSRFEERFNFSGRKEILKEFSEEIENFSLPKGSNKETAKELSRLKKVVTYLNAIFLAIDIELLPKNAFEHMENLEYSLQAFKSFIESENHDHIVQANNNIDQILNIVHRMFVFLKKPTAVDLNKIISSYENSLDSYLEGSIEECDNLVSNFKVNIKETQDSLNSLDAEIENTNKKFDPIRQDIDGKINEFSTTFSDSEKARDEKFDEWFEAEKIEIEDKLKKIIVKANTNLDALEKIRSGAEDVFGVVQNTVQAGAHKNYADEEKEIADKFRKLAIFVMVLAGVILIAPGLIDNIWNGSDFKWVDWLARLPLSLAVLVPAFYLAKESARHRANESHNRKQELTLRTIDSYLKLIDDEAKRDEIKANIAESLFGNNTPANQAEDANAAQFLNQAKDLLKSGK